MDKMFQAMKIGMDLRRKLTGSTPGNAGNPDFLGVKAKLSGPHPALSMCEANQ
jgi:hypothetical protein